MGLRRFKKFNQLNRVKKNYLSWLIWLLPLFLTLGVFNSKSFLLLFVIYGGALFLFKKSLLEALFYVFLFSLPFERVLRSWLLTVVPFGPEFWQPGYEFYFGVSLKLILAITLFLLFMASFFFKKKKIKSFLGDKRIAWMLIFLFGLACVSSFFAFRFDLAITGLIRLWLAIWIFFMGRHFFSQPRIRQDFYKYLISILLFFGVVGTLQFFNGQPLGIDMEDPSTLFPFGFRTTDSDDIYRVSGFMGHPTYFGSFLLLLMPVALGLLFKKISQKIYFDEEILISALALLFGFIAVVGTFSRSAWGALLLVLAVFLVKGRTLINWQLLKRSKALTVLIVGLVIFVFSIGSLVFMRAETLRYVWTLGSGRGRLVLAKQSLTMMENYPVFGIGFNHFTDEMINQGVPEEHRGFIFPVHNTFLLFFSELGIPAGMLFITFVGLLFFKAWRRVQEDWINFGIWIGASTFLISAQFHALFNQDPTFDLFMLMMGYLAALL